MSTAAPFREKAIEALLQLFDENHLHIQLSDIARKLEVEKKDVYLFYPKLDVLIQDYYQFQFEQFEQMTQEIDGFDTFSLEEKLSTMVYTLFDLFLPNRAFVEATFSTHMACSMQKTAFKSSVEAFLKDHIAYDKRVSEFQKLFLFDFSYAMMASSYFGLIRYWIDDYSADTERTKALSDKTIAFVSEILYSHILDKGFELTKYLFRMS